METQATGGADFFDRHNETRDGRFGNCLDLNFLKTAFLKLYTMGTSMYPHNKTNVLFRTKNSCSHGESQPRAAARRSSTVGLKDT
eukprot:scaffold4385_cov162-Skeletonema_menzelii.AAC.1